MKTFFKSIILLIISLLISNLVSAQMTVLDDFNSTDGWQYIKSEGGDVKMNISTDQGHTGTAIRLDYDFTKGTGYSGFQKLFPLNLPDNYEITFWMKANSPSNNFEFKVIDASGDNVWFVNHRNFNFPTEWKKIKIKKRNLEFAWGPNPSPKPPRIDRIEFTIASMVGGKGTIWVDDLKFEQLPSETANYPQPSVTFIPKMKTSADAMFDRKSETFWTSKNCKKQSILIDLKQKREIGGLNIEWTKDQFASNFAIALSDDGKTWENVFVNTKNDNQNNIIPFEDAEPRYIRIDLNQSNNNVFGITELKFIEANDVDGRNKFMIYNALNSEKGDYPSYFLKQASFFTITGMNNDVQEGLLSENGMVEAEKGAFSLEPMIMQNGKLYNWSNVEVSQTMGKSTKPQDFQFVPGVKWKMDNLNFATEVTSGGEANKSSNLYIKYTFINTTSQAQNFDFLVLLRPYQVNPYYQFLNLEGGVGKIKNIQGVDNKSVDVDGKTIYSTLPYQNLSTYSMIDGDVVSLLKKQKFNRETSVTDASSLSTGVLRYAMTLQPNETKVMFVKSPYYNTKSSSAQITNDAVSKEFDEAVNFWSQKINHVEFNLPASADKMIDTYKSQLVYILINRDNAGFQPGSRSYERSWIRDGALTSSALLKNGIVPEVKDYLNWYANYLYENGKVPCVVDKRGPDPVPENDSEGEFIYAIREYYNFTKDIDFLKSKNDKILLDVSYIEKMIAECSTDKFKNGNDSLKAQYGLVPESISHEGYSAKPMHSYWDDFFTIKGLKDATDIQHILGNTAEEKRIGDIRDTFTKNLYNSINLAMKNKGINYIPGCAELGDFDATSTTISLTPCNEFINLPKPQILNTFDKYYDYFTKRKNNTINWVNYTPYENRVIGSFIILNEPERAHDLIAYFLHDQRPQAWNHWAEVVWKDYRYPGYIGDMPHTWVGSDFVNAIRTMFVYENEYDASLVLASALYQDWIDAPEGMSVNHLPTYYGEVSYSIKKDGNSYHFNISGDLKLPANGIKIQNFNDSKMPKKVTVNGKEIKTFTDKYIQIMLSPANVVIDY
ncbi:MAG: discoidin domain-containing protein [Paludibacter sp.]|nr:discoidin domain-containing protein [Paludibacter sp.]